MNGKSNMFGIVCNKIKTFAWSYGKITSALAYILDMMLYNGRVPYILYKCSYIYTYVLTVKLIMNILFHPSLRIYVKKAKIY